MRGMRARSLIARPRAAALPVALLLAALWWGAGPAWADAGSSPVAVFPSPGTSYNLPGTQITFRGIPAADIGDVGVVGSVSGVHTGQIEADSDGQGGSFLPDEPFVPGETVTVTTDLDVLGGSRGTLNFTIAHPSAQIAPAALPVVSAGANGLQHFHPAGSHACSRHRDPGHRTRIRGRHLRRPAIRAGAGWPDDP